MTREATGEPHSAAGAAKLGTVTKKGMRAGIELCPMHDAFQLSEAISQGCFCFCRDK